MVRPAAKRALVAWGQETYGVRQCRACGAVVVARSSVCYKSIRPMQEPLRARIREITGVRDTHGYRRVHVLLRREGWKVNAKRVHRLYRAEGLALRSKSPKRRHAVQARQERPAARTPSSGRAMTLWTIDDEGPSVSIPPGPLVKCTRDKNWRRHPDSNRRVEGNWGLRRVYHRQDAGWVRP